VEAAVIPVALTVTASLPSQTLIQGYIFNPQNTVDTVVIPPGTFTGPVSVSVVTDSGGNWLTASLNGTPSLFGIINPTSVTVTANAAGFGVGSYSGNVVLADSANTLVIPVVFGVDGSVRLTVSATNGTGSVNFAAQVGAGPLPPSVVDVSTRDCSPTECFDVNPDLSSLAASVQTHSGGNWLSASVAGGTVVVSANPTGLGVGVYVGAVTLTANGVGAGQFPVVLVVQGGSAAALVVSPGIVTEFDSIVGGNIQPFSVCASSGFGFLTFSVQVSTNDGGSWLTPSNNSGTTIGPTPFPCISFSVNAAPLAPGTYSANILFTSGTQSITVPVTLTVAEPPGSPLLSSVTSAASATVGPVYPGEVIAIQGLNLGPMTPAYPNSVNILMGGISARILDASPTRITTMVPYEIARQRDITVQVQNNSGSTATWDVPLIACASSATPTSFQIGASGGLATVQLQADASCSWTVANLPIWASISGAISGAGPASLSLNVSANNGQSRSATISVGGFAVQVNQDAASGCTYTLSPGGQAFPAAGGTGSLAITTAPNCQ